MAQPGDFAYQVKQSTDIVRLIGEYVRLKKQSGNRYVGLCPFHQEKTPSFSVNGGMQFYHCFGCGVSGDAFKFVMEMERLTFPEALKMLAERAGIPIPRRSGPEADAEARLRAALFELHEQAAAFYRKQLDSSEGRAAREYLDRRAVSPEMIAEFGLGYAPASGSGLLRQIESRFPADVLEASGLILKRDSGPGHFDRFRGRLMFPIANESGKVIAFGGRALRDEDQPKYLNSSETAIYRKSRVLFNYHRSRDTMRREERVVLVEGYMDAIAVFAAGVRNVVASCGTALNVLHVKTLSPLVKTVVVNYDPDSAGATATERSLNTLLEENLSVRVLSLPGGLDPDEFIKGNGADDYRARLTAAPSFFDFLVERARGRFDLTSPTGRAEAARHLLQYVNKLPDPMERSEMAKDLADRLGLDRQLVGREIAAAAADRRNWTAPAASLLSQCEKELLRVVIEDNDARSGLLAELDRSGMVENWPSRPIFVALQNMAVPTGQSVDLTALMDRLDANDRGRLAGVLNQEGVERIPAERAHQYLTELSNAKKLKGLREQKRQELAAAPDPLAQARISMEINEIERRLGSVQLPDHLLPESNH